MKWGGRGGTGENKGTLLPLTPQHGHNIVIKEGNQLAVPSYNPGNDNVPILPSSQNQNNSPLYSRFRMSMKYCSHCAMSHRDKLQRLWYGCKECSSVTLWVSCEIEELPWPLKAHSCEKNPGKGGSSRFVGRGHCPLEWIPRNSRCSPPLVSLELFCLSSGFFSEWARDICPSQHPGSGINSIFGITAPWHAGRLYVLKFTGYPWMQSSTLSGTLL